MIDIRISNARTPNGDIVSLDIAGGKIVERSEAPARMSIDGAGWMVSPGFVEPHYHLTSCFVEPLDLEDAAFETQIDKLGRRKSEFTVADTVERVSRVLSLMAKRGVVHIRSYADVDQYAGMVCYESLKAARDRHRDRLDLDIVVFPQHGLVSDPKAFGLAVEALQDGARWIGTNPQLEREPERIRQDIRLVYDLAERFGARADFHCDETDRPDSLWLEDVLREGKARGFRGRLTVAHCMSLGKQPEAKRHELYGLMRDLDVTAAISPHAGLLYGDAGAFLPGRGLAPVREMLANGVRVAIAQEAFGSMFAPWLMLPDPVWSGQLMAYATKMLDTDGLAAVWRMISESAAHLVGRTGHGLDVGCRADLVLVRASCPAEALTTLVPDRMVIRDGRLTAASRLDETLKTPERIER
ncbi:MAG: amidohydrolase family protein [Rhizobiales bacterium]|nr:amidohydrolase family protein [Hyphomicrobiales bacterium]